MGGLTAMLDGADYTAAAPMRPQGSQGGATSESQIHRRGPRQTALQVKGSGTGGATNTAATANTNKKKRREKNENEWRKSQGHATRFRLPPHSTRKGLEKKKRFKVERKKLTKAHTPHHTHHPPEHTKGARALRWQRSSCPCPGCRSSSRRCRPCPCRCRWGRR